MKLSKMLVCGAALMGLSATSVVQPMMTASASTVKSETSQKAYKANSVSKIKDQMKDQGLDLAHVNGKYVVRQGDTLSGIAQAANESMEKIANDNNIKNLDLIYVGQVLNLNADGQGTVGLSSTDVAGNPAISGEAATVMNGNKVTGTGTTVAQAPKTKAQMQATSMINAGVKPNVEATAAKDDQGTSTGNKADTASNAQAGNAGTNAGSQAESNGAASGNANTGSNTDNTTTGSQTGNAGATSGSHSNTGNAGSTSSVTGNTGANSGSQAGSGATSGSQTGNTGSNTGNTGSGSQTGSNTGSGSQTGSNTGNSGSQAGSGSTSGSQTGSNTSNAGSSNTDNAGSGSTGNSNTGNADSNTGNAGSGSTSGNTGSTSGSQTGNTGSNTGNSDSSDTQKPSVDYEKGVVNSDGTTNYDAAMNQQGSWQDKSQAQGSASDSFYDTAAQEQWQKDHPNASTVGETYSDGSSSQVPDYAGDDAYKNNERPQMTQEQLDETNKSMQNKIDASKTFGNGIQWVSSDYQGEVAGNQTITVDNPVNTPYENYTEHTAQIDANVVNQAYSGTNPYGVTATTPDGAHYVSSTITNAGQTGGPDGLSANNVNLTFYK